MLNFIKEPTSVWDNLQTTKKPIILYGMGNGADKIIDWCEAHHIKVSGIFATDEFVRYQSFRGHIVRKYSDIIEDFGNNILIVIAFASERPEVLQRFAELAELHETIAPHLPLFAETDLVSTEWLQKYARQLEQAYALLADEKSREVFTAILNYKFSGKLNYLFSCTTTRSSDLQNIFSWSDNESYLDLGAYNGDTIQEFLTLCHKPQQLLAVEPDRRNCRKLRALNDELGLKCEIHECGIWDTKTELSFSDSGGRQSSFFSTKKNTVPVNSIDNIVLGRSITYIKMDVEGAETQALNGGKITISTNKPKLFIAAYHYDNDLWRLPLMLKELVPDYKLYLRKHPYVPCWEINYLAAP